MDPENGQGQQGSSSGRRLANTAVNVGRTIARKAVQEGIKRIGQFAASSTGVGLLLAGGIEALDAAQNQEAYVKKIIYIVTAIVLFLIILIVLIVLVISEGGSGLGAGGGNTASGSASACTQTASGSASMGDTLSHSEALTQLSAAGISTNGKCPDKNNSSCTSLDGVRQNTINGIINLKQKFGGGGIIITGGTETGHSTSGQYTHGNGYKLDISDTLGITDFIKTNSIFTPNGTRQGDHGGPGYKDDVGNEYVLETDLKHWDITFSGNNGAANNQNCSAPPGGSEPTADNCNGKYKLDNPWHKNFGDPNCNFTIAGEVRLLQQYDPSRADQWKVVVRNECSWNPNAYNGQSVAKGAFGCFQMDRSVPDPFLPMGAQSRAGNGPYDRGDLDWPVQASDAFWYLVNKNANEPHKYWEPWRNCFPTAAYPALRACNTSPVAGE